MSDNSLKTPLTVSLDAAGRQRASDGDQMQGKGVPCKITKIISSNLVEVEFQIKGPFTLPRTQMPVSSEEYARVPHQVGDIGIAVPLDYYQGGISGLGGGVADYAQRGNLTNLRFQGIGRKDLKGNVDRDAYTIYGKNGTVFMVMDDQGNKKGTITLDKDKLVIDMTHADVKTVEMKGTTDITFDGNLRVKGNITAGFGTSNVTLLNHTHAQGNDSHGDTEVETNPPTSGH